MVFDAEWFKQHQWWLLPYVSRNRDNLFINTNKPLVEIAPDHVTWEEEKGLYTTEFHVHHVYGRRLYTRLSPLWNLMHRIDMSTWGKAVGLNFGFDTLTRYPDANVETNTVDGEVLRTVASPYESWSTLRTTIGTNRASNSAADAIVQVSQGAPDASTWKLVVRSIFLFDTSAISGGTVSAATVSFYGSSRYENMLGTPTMGAQVVASAPDTNTEIVVGDYLTLGSTAFCDSAIAYSSWNDTGYNDFALNTSGKAAVATAGITKLGARSDWDLSDTSPGDQGNEGASCQIKCCFAEDTTANNGKDPKLVVTYTAASTFVPKIWFF